MAEQAEMADSLSMAFLVLLESLKPVERAVFLLREVFEYELPGDRRDRREVRGELPAGLRPRAPADRGRGRHGSRRRPRSGTSSPAGSSPRVGTATWTELLELLAPDAVAIGDGGGKAYASKVPIHGAQRVATFLVRLFEQGRRIDARLELARVNGQPGALAYDREGRLLSVFVARRRGRAHPGDPERGQRRQAAPPRSDLHRSAARATARLLACRWRPSRAST